MQLLSWLGLLLTVVATAASGIPIREPSLPPLSQATLQLAIGFVVLGAARIGFLWTRPHQRSPSSSKTENAPLLALFAAFGLCVVPILIDSFIDARITHRSSASVVELSYGSLVVISALWWREIEGHKRMLAIFGALLVATATILSSFSALRETWEIVGCAALLRSAFLAFGLAHFEKLEKVVGATSSACLVLAYATPIIALNAFLQEPWLSSAAHSPPVLTWGELSYFALTGGVIFYLLLAKSLEFIPKSLAAVGLAASFLFPKGTEWLWLQSFSPPSALSLILYLTGAAIVGYAAHRSNLFRE